STGIMAALNARERHGEGQLVETSLLQAGLWAGMHPLMQVAMTGVPWPNVGRKKVVNPLRNNYRTADGRWVMFSMLQSDLVWPRVVEAFGDEEPGLRDERFDSHSKRSAHSEEIIALLDEVIGQHTLREWVPIFEKYQFIWEPVQDLDEVIDDPQVVSNRYMVPLETPDGRVETQIGVPFYLSRDCPYPRKRAPEVGEHTEEILLELGYTWVDIQSFKEEKVIV
ncbi:CoA transferase, partial [Chloroflexota bacterium]